MRPLHSHGLAIIVAWVGVGCDTPSTNVVIDNRYPPSPTNSHVIYRAFWQAVSFDAPIAPGSASDPQATPPASANTAYVLVAPGLDPSGTSTPTSFIVLQSRDGFSVSLDHTLEIAVDDTTFAGDCATGSFLSQAQADFITQRVFAQAFTGLSYDAATCTTSERP